jgi:predicted nucleic acid-binding protein
VADIPEPIQQAWGETQAALSAVTIVEFAHGIERAQTDAQRQRRLHELRAAMKVHPLTDEIAEPPGSISGQQTHHGIVIPFADLSIGATAPHHVCDVVTGNVRHCEMIPDLVVKTL